MQNKTFVLAVLIAAVGLLQVERKEETPKANRLASNKFQGNANSWNSFKEITLTNNENSNHPRLIAPSGVEFYIYSKEDVVSRTPNNVILDMAEVTLELNDKRQLIPLVATPRRYPYDIVRIRFRASLGPESNERTEGRLQEIAQTSARTVDKPEWGLREYTPTIAGQLVGYEYVPFDTSFRSIDGNRMWIGCQVGGSKLTNQGPAGCASHFNYGYGLSVTYLFSEQLLPYWRQIYQEVIKFVDSAIVK